MQAPVSSSVIQSDIGLRMNENKRIIHEIHMNSKIIVLK